MTFDQQDPKNLGRPLHFRLQTYVMAIIEMIRADEIDSARWMLANPPAWYRANYPKELQEIKDLLNRNSYSIFDYSNDPDERGYSLDGVRGQISSGYLFPRLNVVDDFIVEQNSQGLFPWIYEISPSHGPLPIALMDKHRSFNFCGVNMNHLATDRFKSWLKPGIWADEPTAGQPKCLVIFEVLEHAHSMDSVFQAAGKVRNDWDHVFLSVPCMCLGGGLSNWHNRRLGHIRTFTPDEFVALAQKEFRGYAWELITSASIVLKGTKVG